MYLLIFPFCLQQDLLMILTFCDATFAAHRHFVLPAVIHQRLFMPIAQHHSPRSLASPHHRLSAGGSCAVCRLGQDRQGHVTLQNRPGGELLVAHGALRADVSLALSVPVDGDAVLAESVATGNGDRDSETLQANDTSQV